MLIQSDENNWDLNPQTQIINLLFVLDVLTSCSLFLAWPHSAAPENNPDTKSRAMCPTMALFGVGDIPALKSQAPFHSELKSTEEWIGAFLLLCCGYGFLSLPPKITHTVVGSDSMPMLAEAALTPSKLLDPGLLLDGSGGSPGPGSLSLT